MTVMKMEKAEESCDRCGTWVMAVIKMQKAEEACDNYGTWGHDSYENGILFCKYLWLSDSDTRCRLRKGKKTYKFIRRKFVL